MNSPCACRFCNIVSGNYQHAGIDQPFARNDEYLAIASIGALVEGWSLVVPKAHQLSMKNVYGDRAFTNFVGVVMSRMVRKYGSLIAFEHGSNHEGSATSCGTNHAHLHLVPFADSLVGEMRNSNLEWSRSPATDIASIAGTSEYLFYADLGSSGIWDNPSGYVHVLTNPISQYFRHLIALHTSQFDKYDYKQYPFLQKARRTRNILIENMA